MKKKQLKAPPSAVAKAKKKAEEVKAPFSKKRTGVPPGIDVIGDAASFIPEGDALTSLRAEAQKAMDLESEVALLSEKVSKLKEEYEHVIFTTLPGLMLSYKCKSFETEDGSKIEVEPFIRANIPSESAIQSARKKDPQRADLLETRRDEAMNYLKKHAADLIKNYVAVEFGKGTFANAKKLVKELKKAGYEPTEEETVHAGTLVAWVREQIEAGRRLPMETFGVTSGSKATITGPRKPKPTTSQPKE